MKYYLVNLDDPTDTLPLYGSTMEDAAIDAIEQLGWEIVSEDDMDYPESTDESLYEELGDDIFAEDDFKPKRRGRKKAR